MFNGLTYQFHKLLFVVDNSSSTANAVYNLNGSSLIVKANLGDGPILLDMFMKIDTPVSFKVRQLVLMAYW